MNGIFLLKNVNTVYRRVPAQDFYSTREKISRRLLRNSSSGCLKHTCSHIPPMFVCTSGRPAVTNGRLSLIHFNTLAHGVCSGLGMWRISPVSLQESHILNFLFLLRLFHHRLCGWWFNILLRESETFVFLTGYIFKPHSDEWRHEVLLHFRELKTPLVVQCNRLIFFGCH